MKIRFKKYQGAGNDFVIIDNREGVFPRQHPELYNQLCDRRFGIGADGLMFLQNKEGYDFEMVYYNADGNESSMCGNGGRCIVLFAYHLGLIESTTHFLAIDGPHDAEIKEGSNSGIVNLKMVDVEAIEAIDNDLFLDTGSPHYIRMTNSVDQLDLVPSAREVRYSERFKAEGTNVNFIEKLEKGIRIRTYERGVEDETLACGTGVTAAAIAAHHSGLIDSSQEIPVKAEGGDLRVSFDIQGTSYRNVWLEGPATFVFDGDIEVGEL